MQNTAQDVAQFQQQLLEGGTIARLEYSATQIADATKRVGQKVSEWINAQREPSILVPLMDGAMPFASALMQHLPIECQLQTLRTQSKGGDSESVRIFDPIPEVAGKHVVIIEDIVDSGRTLEAVKELFTKQGALSVKVASLLNRVNPDRQIQPDFNGIDHVGDEWFIGFGMDHKSGLYRQLPHIFSIHELGSSSVTVDEEIRWRDGQFAELEKIPPVLDFKGKEVPRLLNTPADDTYFDGGDAIAAIMELPGYLANMYTCTPRADTATLVARINLFIEIARAYLWGEKLITDDAREITPLVVGFKGSTIRGKHDPGDIDTIIYYHVDMYERGRDVVPISELCIEKTRAIMAESTYLQEAFGTSFRARGIELDGFEIQISSGGDLRYNQPQIRMELGDPVLLFVRGEAPGSIAVRYLQPSGEWIRRADVQKL